MINLLPPSVKRDVKFAKYNVTLIQYLVVLAATVAVVVFLMLFGQQTLTNTKDDLEESLATDRARAAVLQNVNVEATQLSTTIDTIGAILDQEVKFSYLLREIGSIMPPGAKLSALALSQDSTQPVRLSVDLTTAERAGVLQQNLAESRLFIGADIITVALAAESGEYAYAADLQAYYDPTFPLNSLDDPIEEEVTETEAEPDPAATEEATLPEEQEQPVEEEPTDDDPDTETDGGSSGGAL